MNPICEKCQAAKLKKGTIAAAVVTGVILNCYFDPQIHPCPYLPPEQHTHNERYVPPQYQNMIVTVATSASTIDHESVVEIFDDPERPGFKIHILKIEV